MASSKNGVIVPQMALDILNESTDNLSSPKLLKLERVSAITACDLNSRWHSRLPIIHWSNVVRNTHYICYGAIYKSIYYAVGIWSSPVAQNRFENGKSMLELRRLAIRDEAPKYTATWMLGKMIKDIKTSLPDISKLISYQDTDVHNGTIYKAGNWFVDGESAGISWTTSSRHRNPDQTTAKKIRWAYLIK